MGDLKTSIIVNLSGNLQQRAGQFTNSLSQLGRQGSASMRLLSAGVSAAGRGLDRLGNRYTALLTGAAGVGTVRQVGNLEQRFTRLGIQANRSSKEMDALKSKIFETAKAPDIRVDPGQITSAIEEIIEKTGDLDFAQANIRNIGLALQATGGDGAAIGGIMAEFQKMGLGAKEALEALDILTVQGKEGAFTLQNLAALGPRVVTAYTAMGRTGVPAIREMGAALQVIRQGTGSSEMAATAFEAVLRTLGDADKVKLLQRNGIRIFEPGSTTVMRALPEIMEEIIKKTKGSKIALSKIFDAEAIRSFNAAAGEFQRTGKVESLQRFNKIQADGGTITRDSIRAAKDFNAALTNLYTVWQQFADNQLSEPVKQLTAYLDGLKPGTVERWMAMGKNIAIIGGGLVMAQKLGLFKIGGRMLGGAVGEKLGGALNGVVPVYVTNPGFGTPGINTGPLGKVPASPVAKLLAGAAPLLPAVIAATVATVSQKVGQTVAEKQVGMASTPRLKEWLDQQMMKAGGPDSYQAELIKKELDRREVAEMEKRFSGKLEIEIKSAHPTRVTQMQSTRGFDIDVDSGLLMRSH
jgi:hypothetical protein